MSDSDESSNALPSSAKPSTSRGLDASSESGPKHFHAGFDEILAQYSTGFVKAGGTRDRHTYSERKTTRDRPPSHERPLSRERPPSRERNPFQKPTPFQEPTRSGDQNPSHDSRTDQQFSIFKSKNNRSSTKLSFGKDEAVQIDNSSDDDESTKTPSTSRGKTTNTMTAMTRSRFLADAEEKADIAEETASTSLSSVLTNAGTFVKDIFSGPLSSAFEISKS